MGKTKKITEKVKQFYRGPANKPNKVATENDMITIFDSFGECLPLRDKIFITNWRGEQVKLRLVVGLSASLRALKQKRTKAIIYDDTTANHLAKYLNEFARLQRLPILQAKGLLEKAPKFQLTSLLVVSIVTVGSEAPTQSAAISVVGFDRLCNLLADSEALPVERIEFKEPVLEKVPSSGKSKQKKQDRKAKAAASKQTHVAEIKRVKMSKKVRHQGKRK